MWNIVIAGLLAVVIVLLFVLLRFCANVAIPFMESCKFAIARLAGDSETGRVGEIGRLRDELAEIRVRLQSISDSKVVEVLERIDDHLFVDVCRAIEEASSKDAVNDAARETTTKLAILQVSLELQLQEIAKYLAEISVREPR